MKKICKNPVYFMLLSLLAGCGVGLLSIKKLWLVVLQTDERVIKLHDVGFDQEQRPCWQMAGTGFVLQAASEAFGLDNELLMGE